MTTAFAGRLFGPGLSGVGAAAVGSWRDGSLVVVAAGVEVATVAPTISGGGFNAAVVRFSWSDAAGSWVFCIEEASALEVCRAAAPASLASQIEEACGLRRQVERRFRLGWIVLGAIFLLPLLVLAGAYLQRDRLAEWVVARIPHAQEAQLGELALKQTQLTTRLIESGPAVDALRTIGEPLTKGSPHRYRWFVADDPAINAFAAPGGVVVVNSGLIRAAKTPEEIAGVVAHEVAHAELRHTLKAMVKSLGLQALVAMAFGDLSGSAAIEAARHLTELSFSREAEREADREGLRRLVEAKIDPHGMAAFFETLEREQKLAPPAFLSTHPDTVDRLAALRVELAGIKGGWPPLPVDLAAVKGSLQKP